MCEFPCAQECDFFVLVIPSLQNWASSVNRISEGICSCGCSHLQRANYRPDSLITNFSKIFEIIIYRWTIWHIHCHNILFCEQFGFRKGLSMDSATYKLTKTIFDPWSSGKCVYFVTWRTHFTVLIVNCWLRKWNFIVLEVSS